MIFRISETMIACAAALPNAHGVRVQYTLNLLLKTDVSRWTIERAVDVAGFLSLANLSNRPIRIAAGLPERELCPVACTLVWGPEKGSTCIGNGSRALRATD